MHGQNRNLDQSLDIINLENYISKIRLILMKLYISCISDKPEGSVLHQDDTECGSSTKTKLLLTSWQPND